MPLSREINLTTLPPHANSHTPHPPCQKIARWGSRPSHTLCISHSRFTCSLAAAHDLDSTDPSESDTGQSLIQSLFGTQGDIVCNSLSRAAGRFYGAAAAKTLKVDTFKLMLKV